MRLKPRPNELNISLNFTQQMFSDVACCLVMFSRVGGQTGQTFPLNFTEHRRTFCGKYFNASLAKGHGVSRSDFGLGPLKSIFPVSSSRL